MEGYNWKEKVIIALDTESDIHFETNFFVSQWDQPKWVNDVTFYKLFLDSIFILCGIEFFPYTPPMPNTIWFGGWPESTKTLIPQWNCYTFIIGFFRVTSYWYKALYRHGELVVTNHQL